MKNIGISMIGGGFMGKLHTLAIQSYPVYYYPPKANVTKECVVDIDPEIARTSRERFGFDRCATDWKELMNDDRTTAVVVATPNFLHKPIVMEAIKAGKHVFCEKPLAMNGQDAYEMYQAAKEAGVVHAVGHNNRALSAVRLMKQLIDKGALGEIYSIQMRYVQAWGMDPEAPMQWRFDASKAGTGTLGDTGSHALDIGRYLLGDYKRVTSLTKTFVKERNIAAGALLSKVPDKNQITGRQKVDVDDDIKALVEFESGVSGILWSSRFCMGHEDTLDIEVYGSMGSARFSRERPNELEFYSGKDEESVKGFRKIKMGPQHPNGELWPMADLGVGYVEQKCVEYKDFFEAIADNKPGKVATSFYDGFKVCQVIDAIAKSAQTGQWVEIDNTI
ncbi:Gfo/Idh/MocA family oxidoreductase [Blautia schinkii]|nr:Gfo/Idh/MocA family oxidoreductase [Blautia schinkii]